MAKKEMEIVEKAQSVLKTPTKFFNAVQREKGLKPAFIYLAVISLISSVLSYFSNPMLKGFMTLLGPGVGVAAVILLWIAGLILSFIIYGFFHLFVMLLGGKGGYENTYKVFVYSTTPYSLIGWIAVIFFGFGFGGMPVGALILAALVIWTIHLIVTGLSITHKISKARALAAMLIPVTIIITMIIAILVVWTAFASGTIPTA